MLAIMGASGAGKTTLLDTLSGRLDRKRFQVSGSVDFFREKGEADFDDGAILKANDVGYVYQVGWFSKMLQWYSGAMVQCWIGAVMKCWMVQWCSNKVVQS